MTNPYTYRTEGAELKVARTDANDSVRLEIDSTEHGRTSVVVLTEDLPDFIAVLCGAAGGSAPIVLDRPDPKHLERASSKFGTFIAVDGAVRLEDDCDHCGTMIARTADPTMAIAIAAVVAAMGEWVAAEPDPEDVERLAEAMRDLNPPQEEWNASKPQVPVHVWAKALLRRFNITERTHG